MTGDARRVSPDCLRGNPLCAWCGNACELDVNRLSDALNFNKAPGQKWTRATYFNPADDVDFCGAHCSLEWTQAVRRSDPWRNPALDRYGS